MKTVAMLVACMGILCSAGAHAVEQPLFSTDGFAQERGILANNPMFANDIRTGHIDVDKLGIALIDVNGDGEKEIFVHDYNAYSCGTQGCSTYVFEKQGTQYLSILSVISGDTLAVGDKSSNRNSYRDIYIKNADGRPVRWSFDGNGYVLND